MTNPSPLKFTTAPGTPVSLAPGASPKAIVLADFNGDKVLDILTGNGEAQNGTASVLLGNGAGSFGSPITLRVNGNEPEVAAVGDFNGDGFADIVTANETVSGNVSVFLGNGSGGFSATPSVLAVGNEPHTVIVADVNKDRRLDLITANQGSNNVSVLLGTGSGTFSAATNYSVGSGVGTSAVAAGDFNADGNVDLVTANLRSNDAGILFGDGRGGFTAQPSVVVGDAPYGVVTGDFNGDGRTDFATANQNDISIVINKGDGSFNPARNVTVGRGVSSIATADLNGDKILDIVTSNFDTDDVSVLIGKGDGTFADEVFFTVGDAPFGIAIGDVNGDGKPDLVTPNVRGGNASVLLNQTTLISLSAPTVDASAEKTVSINADLTTGSLLINSNPTATSNIAGYSNVIGSQLDDVITGSVAANRLEGQGGNDTITGLGGDDTLIGGLGRDRLLGGDGNDRMIAGAGNDRMRGGEGGDRFIFDIGKPFDETVGVSRILDFKKGEDKIVLDQTTFDRLGRRLFNNRVSFASVGNERAAGKSDSLITYVRSTGSLYYNPNGNTDGFGDGGLFATLRRPGSANGILASNDFLVQA